MLGKIPEETFDHVEPRRTGRGEMHMKSFVPFEPVHDFLMFVRRIVVANNVDLFVFGYGAFDLIEKPNPFLMTMLWHTGSDDRTVQDVERGK